MPLDIRPERGPGSRPNIRIDVEPLSESRWAKIEGSLFEQLESEEYEEREVREGRVATPHFVDVPQATRWRAGAYFVVAGAVAAAIGALVSRAVWHPDPPAAISSHVETGSSGTHLLIGEAALDVGPEAALLVNGDDMRGVLVVLERGRVDFEVAPRRERPPFVVQAGDARVRVTGTRFSVDRTDDGARVDVTSGVVEVTAHGEMTNVRAGEHWPSKDTSLSAASPAPPITTDPSPASTPADAPRASRRTSNSPRQEATPPAPPVAEDSEPTAPMAPTGEWNNPPTSSFAPREPDAAARRALYESAARLEATRPLMSLAQYAELTRGSDPWAANALFASGRLQSDRGMREQARRTLEEYLVRFPRGANANDARDLLGRLKGQTKLP